VKDAGGLLKPATVQKADLELQELQRRYHCSVFAEAFAKFPEEKPRPALPLPGLRTPSDESVTRWAKERAQAAGEYDVYLLICKEPLRVRVVAREEAFSLKEARELRDRIERGLEKTKDFDAALLSGIEFLRGTLDAKLHPPQSHSAVGWLWILGIIGGILGLWLVVGLIRAKLDARGCGAGGHFLPCLFGGMFGMATGHWIYESLFSTRTAPPTEAHPNPPGPPEIPAAADEETVQDPDYAGTEDVHRGSF